MFLHAELDQVRPYTLRLTSDSAAPTKWVQGFRVAVYVTRRQRTGQVPSPAGAPSLVNRIFQATQSLSYLREAGCPEREASFLVSCFNSFLGDFGLCLIHSRLEPSKEPAFPVLDGRSNNTNTCHSRSNGAQYCRTPHQQEDQGGLTLERGLLVLEGSLRRRQ